MITFLDPMREMSLTAVLVRLTLAMLLGGLVGLERVRKRRPAGIRTYMLVSIGAALTMVMGQYHDAMLSTFWAEAAQITGINPDIARFSAQVINGIGFLGAGTVIVTGKQEVKGLTTAAGLWASACVGLAIGAGFYECVVPAFLLITLCNLILPYIEAAIIENALNMNVYVEFDSLDHFSDIISCIKSMDTHIYEVDIERGYKDHYLYPSATISMGMKQRKMHAKLILTMSELECVRKIDEI